MTSDFDTSYKQLNDEQKQAVDDIDGPLLVIAGPGTGKTQLLSLRVANILKKTDTDPSSILCLTFTNFAATNMRERLNKQIGGDSLNVNVQTFHSLAADIMAMYPSYFWKGAPLTIAPDVVQLNTLHTILANLPLNSPLASKFGGKYTAFNDIKEALKLSKEAGLTPAKLQTMIDINQEYIDTVEQTLVDILSAPLSHKKLADLQSAIHDLPEQQIDEIIQPLKSLGSVIKNELDRAIEIDMQGTKTTETGKWKKRWVQSQEGKKGMFKERQRNLWWQSFIEVYEAYQLQLHLAGYYDYSDMIVEVITQLESQPELRSMVQERYLYILIDEFQDTNAAQLRLAHLIATYEGDNQAPNLMAVGDDDQTIFAFNGAELNNMLFFKSAYPSTKLIVLKQNYRSHQSVLDTSGHIINQAEDRIVNREADIIKDLVAATKLDAGEIKHWRYPTREHQFSEVAKRIQNLWQNNHEGTIAVLARKHDSLIELSAILNKLEVPIRYEKQNNVLDQEIIEQVCLIAETVQGITDGDLQTVNAKLASLLRHPMWQVSAKTLWELAIENYRNTNWLRSILKHEDKDLNALANWLMELSKESVYQPLQIMIEEILGLDAESEPISPLRRYFLSEHQVRSQYLDSLSACNTLLELTKELAGVRKKAHLKDFINYVQLSRDLEKPIVDQSWFVSGENAVQLMTVHKSKGLEFDTVFLIDAIEDHWKPRRGKSKSPANLPLQSYGEVYDDYVRLMYVAATRAKRSFIVSGYRYDELGKDILATPLLSNIIDLHEVEDSSLSDPIEVLENTIMWPRLDNADEKSLLKARLEDFQLNATSLYNFLDIQYHGPQDFLELNLLKIPSVQTPNMAYGNAMHAALQSAQILVTKKQYSLQAIQQIFIDTLSEQAIRPGDFVQYKQKGIDTLERVFSEFELKLLENGRPEVPVFGLMVGDALIGGKIDHVLEDEDLITITDYKTGKAKGSFNTKDKSKMVSVWRYRLQLDFYALLIQKSSKDAHKKSIRTQIAYLGADNKNDFIAVHEPSAEDLARLEQVIKAVWIKIINLDFPDTSKYSQDMAGIEAFTDDLINGDI